MNTPEEKKMQALFKAAGAAEPMSAAELERQWGSAATHVAAKPALNGRQAWTLGGALVVLGALMVALRPAPAPTDLGQVSLAPAVVQKPLSVPPMAKATPAIHQAPAAPAQRPPTVKTKATPFIVSDDGLLAEAQLIARAAQTLRAQHNASEALTLLDEHTKRFSSPTLADEARLLRIEALIAAEQPEQALALLRSDGPSSTPRTEMLRLLEAELLSQLNQCGEALQTLEPLLAPTVSRTVQERALIDRAACASTIGDFQSSRHTLEQYLERFPSGSFAEEARQRLEHLP
ncbi:MAG: hypothetical protein K1X64_22715 [Myxococcaceae bacterium]|nr:hypothetical protein [Myxococcaceae bacterium]